MSRYSIKYIVKDDKGIHLYTIINNETGLMYDVTADKILNTPQIMEALGNCKVVDGKIETDAKVVYLGEDMNKPCNTTVTGWNDLDTWCRKHNRPDILLAYFAGNNGVQPLKLSFRKAQNFHWKCMNKLPDGTTCGYEWDAMVHNVVNSKSSETMCPACRARNGKGTTMISGLNDLESWCKANNRLDILQDYNLANNIKDASSISQTSHDKVNWKCHTCGHEWNMQLQYRTYNNYDCPNCNAKKGNYTRLLKGVNDLETWCKENDRLDIIQLWSQKNKLKPSEVQAKTDTVQVYVQCRICKGLIETKPYYLTRSNQQTICKHCKIVGTSVPQLILDGVLKRRFKDVEYRYKLPERYEIDEYIPSLKLGIEYNGLWHAVAETQIRDQIKSYICDDLGIQMLYIQEHQEKINTYIDGNVINIQSADNQKIDTYRFIVAAIGKAYKLQLAPISADEFNEILKYVYSVAKRESVPGNITETHPEIAATWDYEKNDGLRPEQFTKGSHKEVYWICTDCPVPHSYKKDIHHRCRGQQCPVQAGKAIMSGVNDLETVNPGLLRFWNYEKNNADGVYPNKVAPKQTKKVWWKCPICGYEWYKEIQVFQVLKKCKQCREIINY